MERILLRTPYNLPANVWSVWKAEIFGSPAHALSVYQTGVIDEDTIDGMTVLVEKLPMADEHRLAVQWLQKRAVPKLFAKLGKTSRINTNIYPNLPQTNDVESINNLLGIDAGKKRLSQAELVDVITETFRSRLEDITRALIDLGPYALLDKGNMIPRSKQTDEAQITKHLITLFGANPDKKRTLSIWKAVPSPGNNPNSTQLKTKFEGSGLSVLHKAAFQRALHYEEFPGKIIPWPFPNSTIDGKANFGVLSEKDSAALYHVTIDEKTGNFSCRCHDMSLNNAPVCKHIVAAASKHSLLENVILNLASEATALKFPKTAGAGDKPSRRLSRPGAGYTNRLGLQEIKSQSVARAGGPDKHPQSEMLEQLEKRKDFDSSCDCCGKLKHRMPWHRGAEPFYFTRQDTFHCLMSCPGCSIKFIDNPPALNIVLTRDELDFVKGKQEMIKAPRKRRYCLKLSCIKKRHPHLNPKSTPKLDPAVVDFSLEELELISRFRTGNP